MEVEPPQAVAPYLGSWLTIKGLGCISDWGTGPWGQAKGVRALPSPLCVMQSSSQKWCWGAHGKAAWKQGGRTWGAEVSVTEVWQACGVLPG